VDFNRLNSLIRDPFFNWRNRLIYLAGIMDESCVQETSAQAAYFTEAWELVNTELAKNGWSKLEIIRASEIIINTNYPAEE